MATSLATTFNSSTNGNRREYACDCGRKCLSQTELNEHQANNCRNRELQCSFCQKTQPSSRQLSEHLMLCGNKTDQCPNCLKFIRRAIFAYHYENNCADLDEPDNPAPLTRISSTNRPSSSNISKSVSKKNDFIDEDQENKSDSASVNDSSNTLQRISSARSRNKSPSDIKECRYCRQRCLRGDYDAHKKNCLQHPKNLNKDQQRTSSTSTKPESRPLTNEDRRSNDIIKIPCEFCNEEIDLNLWTIHSEDCRKREKRRIEARAKAINDEPVIERLPCEHCEKLFSVDQLRSHEVVCRKNPDYIALLTTRPAITQPPETSTLFNGLTNTRGDPTLPSTYSSLPSSHGSAYNLSPETEHMLHGLEEDRENNATLKNEPFSSYISIDVKPTQERSRLRDGDRSSLRTTEYQLPKKHEASDHIGSPLMNSSSEVSAYGTSSLLTNNPPLSQTQSLVHRIYRTLSTDRSSKDRQTEEYLSKSRRAPSPSTHSSYSSGVSIIPRNDRGSLSATSSRANRPLLAANNNLLFGSTHDADLEHQPIINERGHSARNGTKSKSSSTFVQPPMKFNKKKNEYGF